MKEIFSENKKFRLAWVDVLRGFLILLVILGHSFQNGDYNNSMVWNIIYSFHMSAFFVLSGWIGYTPDQLNAKSILKKATNLLLPFVVWTIVKIIVDSSPENYGDNFLHYLMHPDATYWFLYVLFIVILMLELWKWISNKFKSEQLYIIVIGEILIFLVMVAFEPRLFGFQFIAYYSFFYCLGFLVRKYRLELTILQTLIMGLCWFVMACFWKMHDVPMPLRFLEEYIPSTLLSYSYRLVTAIFGSLFFLNLARIVFSTRKLKVLEYLGTITLELYIVHLAFGDLADSGLNLLVSPSDSVIYNILNFVARTILSVIIIDIIIRLPRIRFWLFGRRK